MKRREEILKSGKELPGDPDRAKAEESEDFDAPSRTLGSPHAGMGNAKTRAAINESDVQLTGDLERGDDDQFIDEHGPEPRDERPSQSTQRTNGDKGEM